MDRWKSNKKRTFYDDHQHNWRLPETIRLYITKCFYTERYIEIHTWNVARLVETTGKFLVLSLVSKIQESTIACCGKKNKMLNKLPNREISSFPWSFRPLLICMKIFGMNLEDQSAYDKVSLIQKASRFLLLIFGVVLLMSNVFINCMSIQYDLKVKIDRVNNYGYIKLTFFSDDPEKQTKFLYFYVAGPIFEHLAHVALVTGNHLIFFCTLLLTSKWSTIWFRLIQIQQRMRMNMNFYRKCRNYCLFALGSLVPSFIFVHVVRLSISWMFTKLIHNQAFHLNETNRLCSSCQVIWMLLIYYLAWTRKVMSTKYD